MQRLKIICADSDLVFSPRRDENEDACFNRGLDSSRICICCGKEIKNIKNAKQLHLIEGGSYFTEYEGTVNEKDGSDMYWYLVGSACYRKFLKNKKEVEIVNNDI